MAFWRRKSARKAPGSARPRPAQASASDCPVPAEQAVDFIADLLRIYGENAFDVGDTPAEDTRERCENWARHLIVGVPPPGRGDPEPADDPQEPDAEPVRPEPSRRRDLPGLRLYFSGHREEEQQTVTRSLGDFREAVWAFIQGLRRTITADEASDRQVSFRMRRLEAAVHRNAMDEIKHEALEMVGVLSRVLAERTERQESQLAALGDHLNRLRVELDAVREQAARDSLSGLYNRASFDLHIERVADFSTLLGKNAYLVMIDIDHFKWINDSFGHPCGDEVLRRVSDCLRGCFLRKDDFVARYGGEEFGVVIREGELPAAEMLAERSLDAMRDLEIEFQEETLRVTASAGMARLRRGESPQAWVERADRALYEAKQAGRDQLVIAGGDGD